ncbi:site-specific integrase [Urbifossiella limnaea]|uniref:Uncharacterized protein n=1 Tax=Urbifossiella limnaea TaxID=2528023 RepID=A0A517XWC0_9BACT|nr:hypothetical protein [Urbifossiella limnaea]QDU21806.1 hypothetical protein ETAA1_37790 [Urbifossiella limnaea]
MFADAGGLDHDHVRGVAMLSTMMKWPSAATLKDLRHLFATTLNNAGVPEGYVRYFLSHAPGKAAVVAYTHLGQLRRRSSAVLEREQAPLLDAVDRRAAAAPAADSDPRSPLPPLGPVTPAGDSFPANTLGTRTRRLAGERQEVSRSSSNCDTI